MQQRRLANEPFYVLDNGLNPLIADLMGNLGYRIRSVQSEFGIAPTESVDDEDIIKRLASEYGFRGVWITKDKSSKREHVELAKLSRVSVIWIKQQTLSTSQQHLITTHCYHKTFPDLLEAKGPIHYEVNFHGQSGRESIRVKVIWNGPRT